jgi:hypothetical protein
VPSAANQARQLTDNTTRNTYDPNQLRQALNMARNRVPGLSKGVQPKVGPLGQELQNYQDGHNNLFNVAFNPSYITKYQPDQAAELPLGIMDRSGETKQIPTTIKTTQKVNGANLKLSDTQNHDLQQYVGEHTKTMLEERNADPAFQKLTDDEKAKEISGRISDIQAAGRAQLLGDTPSKTTAKAVNRVLDGKTSYAAVTNINAGTDKKYKETLQGYSDMTPEERKAAATKQPDFEYKYLQAKYENDKKNGTLSQAQEIKARNSVDKAKVGSSFDKQIRDLYNLGKADIYDVISTDDNGKDIAAKLLAYGDALEKAGVTRNKFRTIAGVSFAPKTSRTGTGKTKSVRTLLSGFKLPSDGVVKHATHGSAIARAAHLKKK